MTAPELPPAAAPAPAGRGRVEPLSPARYKVQFTADERLKHKLDRVTELLRHSNPVGDLAAIVERAVDLLLADVGAAQARGRADRHARGFKRTA
jgi:hypothetical protein